MITLDVVELADGRFGIQAVGAPVLFEEADTFNTRLEAEEWIFERAERLELRGDPHTLNPGSGQGLR